MNPPSLESSHKKGIPRMGNALL